MKTVKTIQKIMIMVMSLSFMACVHDDDYDTPPENEGQVLTSTIDIPQIKATAPVYTGNVAHDSIPESIPFANGEILEGYVISTDQGGNVYKNLFIVTDDGKQGILLSINKSSIYTSYPLGSKIYVKLDGLYYGKQNGMVQIGMKPTQSTRYIVDQITPSVMASNIILGKDKKDEEDLVIKTNSGGNPLTINDVNNNESYLCTLVELSNMEFNDAGSTFVRENVATSNQVNDFNLDYFAIRVSNYATFAGYIIPYGVGKIRGVMTRYDGSYNTYQLLIRTIDDVKEFDFTLPVFYETFTDCQKSDGSAWVSPWAKIANVTGFDMGDPVTYSDPYDAADVRSTASINKHVWLPANRESSLVISGINTLGYHDLKLSYKIRTNSSTPSDVNILRVKYNGVELTIPPLTVANSEYVTIKIPDDIPSLSSATLEFYTTLSLNTVGIRLDNIKITGPAD
ncbi:MAG: DUF5689 domain-containing protein [Flavobacteriaceae bacterium]|jgi:hypothetical protein|nr:DUF5689 domain-containing protein [Flavobacteriaceae bacterium]